VKTIYVGNLPEDMDEEGLRALFAAHGAVQSVMVVADPETGRSRCFGFVDMEEAGALLAIAELDGYPHSGGTMRVNEARDRGRKAPRRAW